MLTAFPAAESFLGPGWDYPDPFFLLPPLEEPVTSNSGSVAQNPTQSNGSDEPDRNELKTGSDELNRNNLKNKRSGSDESSQLDERKRRRMISNRESARRSRMRKQRHLENLRSQATRFKVENREHMNRLRVAVHHTQIIRNENERLRAEGMMLRQRLWDIRQVLLVRQLQQIYPTAMH